MREHLVILHGPMAGYSLKQILKLMKEERLIDSYSIEPGDEIIIHMGSERVRCPAHEATDLLLQRIRCVNRGSGKS